MRLLTFSILVFSLAFSHETNDSSIEIGQGEQPQVSQDTNETIRLVYGNDNKIYYAVSNDKRNSFSKPSVIASVKDMHLGMSRGPQLASSKDYSIVTAIDKPGTIHSFLLHHETGKWSKIKNVNDADSSAMEGLMSIAADDVNNFYATWLDVRDDKNNKIAISSLSENGSWSENKIIYKSPDQTVCECCKPSIAVRGHSVSVMFRNWIKGSRDLYLISSTNKASAFGSAQKLGTGTWKLKGCPMDGGGLYIDAQNSIHTVWQREGQVYYAMAGRPEEKIADGRSCTINGDIKNILFTWEEGAQLKAKTLNGKEYVIGEGTALKTIGVDNNNFFAVWEKDGSIFFKKLLQ